MDTFDLKWPKTDATFYTDGWRCRIVWRQKHGGLGGTIDNNDQCKRRVADSLESAPYLLSALKARGHGLLAEEIEALAGDAGDYGEAEAAGENGHILEAAPPPAPSFEDRLQGWLDAMEGEVSWEEADSRRAKTWQACGDLDDESLLLKAPAPRGKQEWVLKRTWEDSKRKALYVVSANLRGLCAYLCERGAFADAAAVETWLGACEPVAHPELASATTCWREHNEAGATH